MKRSDSVVYLWGYDTTQSTTSKMLHYIVVSMLHLTGAGRGDVLQSGSRAIA